MAVPTLAGQVVIDLVEDDGSLRGYIYFHLGDDSGFHAVPNDDSQPQVKRVRGAPRSRR